MILFEYLDIHLKWKNEKPVFKFVLKHEKKITHDFPLKCIVNNKRVCKSGEPYYTHYLGEIGKLVYEERKKLFNLYNLIPFYILHYKKDEEKLLIYLEILKTNNSEGLLKMYSGPHGEERKNKNRQWAIDHKEEVRERYRNLWKSEEYRKTLAESETLKLSYEERSKTLQEYYKDPINKEKFLISARAEDRINKISISSKNVWKNLKDDNIELFNARVNRLINICRRKGFKLNECNLNSIEYKIGCILNEFGLLWNHNKCFKFKNYCYFPDFYVESKKLIIECYGDFYHGNPNVYKMDDALYKNKFAKEIWEADDIRKNNFENNGYRYMFFWETDIRKNIQDIKQKIYEYTK